MVVLVIGNAMVDLGYRITRLPALGETAMAAASWVDVGGKGVNQAIAAARAGAEVRLLAPIGDDEPGRRVSDRLAQEPVLAELLTVRAPTDESVILVTDDGANTMVSTAAAAHALPTDTAVAAAAALGPGDILLMQGNLPVETSYAALVAARVGGARTVLNLAPVREGAATLMPHANILIANEAEAAALVAITEPEDAARAILTAGASAVAITLAAEGVLLIEAGGEPLRIPAPEVDVLDTTGAGDVLCGTVAACLVRGLPLTVAMTAGVHAATLKVARVGTSNVFPTADEIDAILDSLPGG